MPPLESDGEEVKEEKRLKILTPNKLLTRLSVMLAKIKARNNSNKLKTKYFCIGIIKLPKNFTTIQSSQYNIGSTHSRQKTHNDNRTQNFLF